eukprot:1181541-Prorocentrum_minimum.AAC.1
MTSKIESRKWVQGDLFTEYHKMLQRYAQPPALVFIRPATFILKTPVQPVAIEFFPPMPLRSSSNHQAETEVSQERRHSARAWRGRAHGQVAL